MKKIIAGIFLFVVVLGVGSVVPKEIKAQAAACYQCKCTSFSCGIDSNTGQTIPCGEECAVFAVSSGSECNIGACASHGFCKNFSSVGRAVYAPNIYPACSGSRCTDACVTDSGGPPAPPLGTCVLQHQSPDLSDSCFTCVAARMPGQIKFVQDNQPLSQPCSDKQALLFLCNNGMPETGNAAYCSEIQHDPARCASACGFAPAITSTPTPPPGATATPTLPPRATATPTPPPGATATTVPPTATPTPITKTAFYRFSDKKFLPGDTGTSSPGWLAYTDEPVAMDYLFKDAKVGDNLTLFAQFQADNGQTSAVFQKSIKYVGSDPKISSIACNYDPSGAGTAITINGFNLGSEQGNGTVKLLAENLDATILSWGSEEIPPTSAPTITGNVSPTVTGTSEPTSTPTPNKGTCQCDLWGVVEDQCNSPYTAACTSKFECACGTFSTTSTPTPTPTVFHVCSHPAPRLGCYWEGPDVYPECGAQLVCDTPTPTLMPTITPSSDVFCSINADCGIDQICSQKSPLPASKVCIHDPAAISCTSDVMCTSGRICSNDGICRLPTDSTLGVSIAKSKIEARVDTKLTEGRHTIKVTTNDGRIVTGTCNIGLTTLDFTQKTACLANSATLAEDNVVVDITEKAEKAKSLVKGKIKIDVDGKPVGFTPKLEIGKSYVLTIRAPKTVSRKVEFTAEAGTTNLEDIILPVGDIFPVASPDNKVNAFDKAEMTREWSLITDVTRPADLNSDSRVNSVDYSCLQNNYNKSGD